MQNPESRIQNPGARREVRAGSRPLLRFSSALPLPSPPGEGEAIEPAPCTFKQCFIFRTKHQLTRGSRTACLTAVPHQTRTLRTNGLDGRGGRRRLGLTGEGKTSKGHVRIDTTLGLADAVRCRSGNPTRGFSAKGRAGPNCEGC